MNPSAIPLAMLDVNGMATMTKKAGNDSSKCVQSISLMLLIIILPTIIKLGAVIAATFETAPISGLKKAVIKKRMATINTVLNLSCRQLLHQLMIQLKQRLGLYRTWHQ